MEVVGEVVLSVSLELLFSKLASSDLWKYARQEQVHTELKKWKTRLLEIREVLDDAEDKQITKQHVKEWLAHLRDLAYDVEDVLDEFGYQVMRRKLVAEGDAASTSKVRKFIPTCCTTFTPIQAMRNVKLGSKIEDITRRLEEISAQKAELGLEKLKVQIEGARAATQSPTPPPPLVFKPGVYGRDEDKTKILAMLNDESLGGNLSVVSIVAMGGMGKTTLAGLVYDDEETSKHFALKVWVCVSDQFHVETITRAVLRDIAAGNNDSLDFHQIQRKLRDETKGKRFLIVLDDLWNEKYDQWDSLRSPLLEGAPGSKILVTTRNKNVATMMGGDKNFYELKHLSDNDCWELFKKHAFENRNTNEHPDLALIGREIVKKCGGLPLAAKALGGLLRHEHREDKWNIILASKIWNLPGDKCGILPALRLSYNHLPSHLKRCFAYCALFPQDYEFKKEELILLWMAEGLIQQSNEDEKMEDLGDDYFCELLSRSFFQSSNSNKSRFVMHDLINDLAKSIAGDTCLHLDDGLWNDLQRSVPESTRHSSFIRHDYDIFKKFERFDKKECLHTFIALPIDEPHSFISNKVLEELIPRLGHLRVLSLAHYMISEIPDSFGKLKHLRYLDLSYTSIKWLPDSIGNLFYLQTLKLSCCEELIRLPISIGNLINLRHLDVAGAIRLQEMPVQIGKLKDLRILSNFIVDKNNGLTIKELTGMSHLRRQLCISKLENVVNIQDARDADLKLKRNLESLIMQWSSELDGSGNERNQMDVLDSLQPCLNLNKLCIQLYGGPEFPRWIGDALFSKMVDLSLIDCRKCTSLPCLGQLPSLKQLRIQGMVGVKKVGAEFYGETRVSAGKFFPSLESLHFNSMSEWEHWEDWSSSTESLFPCLHELTIEDCPKLIMKLPTYLPSLTELSVHFCPKLESPLSRLPLLKELHVGEFNEAVLSSGNDLTSLTKLTISRISGLIKLHEGFMQFLQGLRVLEVWECEELEYLWEDGFGSENSLSLEIRDCDQLVSLGCNLQSLAISGCAKLERLPNGWQSLTCLEELTIRDCPKLASFPDVGFPPKLRSLTVGNCKGIKSLPDGMMLKMRNDTTDSNNSCVLESLEIEQCPSLICFPKGQLPTTLKSLRILACENLKSLPEEMMGMCALEDFLIVRCHSLIGLPKGGLPATLKRLTISDCRRLESLPEGIMHHHSTNAAALKELEISVCPSLTSFPRGKFPSTLERLHIENCEHLESISEEMFHSTNNSLQFLTLRRYPNLKTLPDKKAGIVDFENLELLLPQIKKLTRLTALVIRNCENIKTPLSQWGLSRLTSLKDLWIGGMFPDATSFSDDPHSILFPTTLTSLYLSDFQNLESLASLSLQTLTSLEILAIYSCPKLRSILPREGLLPDTLSRLYVWCCPHLKQRYSKWEGDDWPKIAHIPRVVIND
ncbi:putative disease resistance RPP13-like protein 1 [Vitis vinifera]|uniref:putative disease resistance RPP13-like protein 1 n=1 Tax=Vitis vinifera TaxID=29760 RepID=UPI00023B30B1|nr:putative disease resistance RPP13-like protein 1 [Vitis vinifera]XP_010658933.1 putative disease resistance RPP13-like protein 1 [Vitis vinifera]XP_019080158.1 putative disease resistance RPP13-like protein 1 [Vitis vinifera]XP_019080159.1 putative disease resistance RPP13-like protein 1 [Vitis vinifera]XP_019080160.1 putative disease resistance RPP13-like protein 1 [Vitis vinifera]XP_019080162.1 putative disease resistance RPP13-like protein 1 [Vitis vinifera]XP_019080164.1 putative disea|eukprot:XP_002270668.2 PREDICTED: putative disease resistance RPP13-like protein 1 [Vitis vinifera]